MPCPRHCGGLPAAQQHRVTALPDKKKMSVPVSSSTTSSSPLSHISSVHFSVAQNHTQQEVQRLMKEAVTQCHSTATFALCEDEGMVKGAIPIKRLARAGKSHCEEKMQTRQQRPADTREGQVICIETVGRSTEWRYMANQLDDKKTQSKFHMIDTKSNQNPFSDLTAFVRSCIVPEGYPDSVSPSYMPYMRWRALKYFFGGAISVFTTRSLLHAVGVSRGATSTSVAANWVIKDGAGRIGKMLFARHGKKFDCDMKQLRFMGDLLMEFGAAVELATVSAPQLFLPLACAANIAKNVAAVTSTSTRAPIYKAFARGENIGDITAKGECISNIADLLGTGLGIFLSKKNPSLMASFMILSCGYLCSSYQEIKSVLLPTLNRARFGAAVQSFLQTGQVPSLAQGNLRESIVTLPWSREKPCVLGARVSEAFEEPQKFLDLLPLYKKENYMINYNIKRRRAYVVLREKASPEDVLRATFHAQLLMNILEGPCLQNQVSSGSSSALGYHRKINSLDEFKRRHRLVGVSVEVGIAESFKHVMELFEAFKNQATSQGWTMADSLLNPGNARLCAWAGTKGSGLSL